MPIVRSSSGRRSRKFNSRERGATMRFLPTCALLLSLSALPGFSQSDNVANSTPIVLPANASDSSVDYSALRERLAAQNKVLQDQVNTQRAIVKKNQVLLKDAQR